MPDEPTLGEIGWRLDALTAQIVALAVEIREDRASAAATFVRQDVAIREREFGQALAANLNSDLGELKRGWQADVAEIKRERDADAAEIKRKRETDVAWHRQTTLTLAVLAITSLITIGIATFNLLAR